MNCEAMELPKCKALIMTNERIIQIKHSKDIEELPEYRAIQTVDGPIFIVIFEEYVDWAHHCPPLYEMTRATGGYMFVMPKEFNTTPQFVDMNPAEPNTSSDIEKKEGYWWVRKIIEGNLMDPIIGYVKDGKIRHEGYMFETSLFNDDGNPCYKLIQRVADLKVKK